MNQTTGYPAGTHPKTLLAILQGAIAFKPYAIMMLDSLSHLDAGLTGGRFNLCLLQGRGSPLCRNHSLVLIILLISFIIGYLGFDK